MSIAQHPASVPYETYVRMEQERDQWRSRYQAEHQARIQAERERDQQRQGEQQRRKLWQTKLKPAEKATIEAFQHQLDSPHAHRDEQGFTRINYKTASIHIGMSEKTPKVSFDKVLAQCPDLPTLAGAKIETREEYDQELRRNIPRLYIKAEKSLVSAAVASEISERIKQGGNQYECNRCRSKNVVIKRQLCCLDCGHEIDLDPTYPNGKLKNAQRAEDSKTNLSLPPQMGYSEDDGADRADDSQGEKNLTSSRQVVGMVIEPVTPPMSDSLTADEQAEQEAATAEIEAAAELLLQIAGQDERHIVMPRTHPKKYLEVKHPLTIADLLDHLRGGEARGARCRYQDGTTYALIFDTDEPHEWDDWKFGIAAKLVQVGYLVLLDESPAGRGGHLLILFDAPVLAAAARAAVLQIAPELEQCAEYWPSVGNSNRVRLPGAFYARHGRHVEQPVKAWCKLISVATGEASSDGYSAARLLLANRTPAAIVPALPAISAAKETAAPAIQDEEAPACIVVEQNEELEARRAGALPNTSQGDEIASAGAASFKLPEVDAKWEARYGKVEATTYWFAIMPDVAAAWFNEQHPLDSIKPRESANGMALSPNGDERTASTGYYQTSQGERWTDFSTHGRRADGTHEAGDALELASRVWQVSKSVLINEARQQIMTQARADLEAAARNGQPIPAWLEEPCVITPAGRRHYAELFTGAQSQRPIVTPAAVTIVEPEPEPAPQVESEARQVEPEPEAPACIVVEPERQAQASASDLPTVMQERHLSEGKPCEKCGCPIERDLCGELVCCRCFPPRGYHLYSELIDTLYPRKRRLL